MKEKIDNIKEEIGIDTILVAVSKTRTTDEIMKAYQTKQRVFGENKIQELVEKQELLPKDIDWHMIGHLQRNKVKYIASFVSLIHGVDSVKTLIEINKQAKKNNRTINCLLQIKIANEDSKFGFEKQDIEAILQGEELEDLSNIQIVGFMGMATNTEDNNQVSEEFGSLKMFFDICKTKYSTKNIRLKILSMGMSNDYKLAVNNGSNMVRIGSAIFGKRNY
ncbi:MAG: YggS family pyridoxal phosphate-dependent enzyme [Flavobacteriaceae bacterium]|nr:YggS family pyridoxal phosphate-dependent enzyme [Flavobacteriaceae bacterium]